MNNSMTHPRNHPSNWTAQQLDIRDQILATLRDMGRPATTTELGETISAFYSANCFGGDSEFHDRPCNRDKHCDGRLRFDAWTHFEDHDVIIRHPMASSVTIELEALQRAGLVQRAGKLERRVLWELTREAAPIGLDDMPPLDVTA